MTGGRSVERLLGAERIVRIRRAGEHGLVEPVDELVGGVGEIAGDFLLDRAFLVVPLGLRIVHAGKAVSLGLQSDVEVGRRDRGEVLRDDLLGVGIVVAAQLRVDRGGLVGGHAGASAERHVLFSVGHAGEPVRRLVAADNEVGLDGDDGRKRVAHQHNAHAVLQRGAG